LHSTNGGGSKANIHRTPKKTVGFGPNNRSAGKKRKAKRDDEVRVGKSSLHLRRGGWESKIKGRKGGGKEFPTDNNAEKSLDRVVGRGMTTDGRIVNELLNGRHS